MSKISKVVSSGLCLGCGLCEAILGDGCEMTLDKKGFYYPKFKETVPKKEEALLENLCPAINIQHDINQTEVWGNAHFLGEAWSLDDEIRHTSSSGGFITGFAVWLLENSIIDRVLHVGAVEGEWLYNELSSSVNREDVIGKSGSRYAPAKIFNDIINELENLDGRSLFIGKPCDVHALNRLMKAKPHLKDKVFLKISIFCAGIPSYNATISLANRIPDSSPVWLRYRGFGWPGKFSVFYESGALLQMSYEESWGNHLGKDINFRCKICPDGIGLDADISVGDSWHDTNGYPSFEDAEGRSVIIVRSSIAQSLVQKSAVDRALSIQKGTISQDSLSKTQRYQFERRVYSFYRFLAFSLKHPRFLKFKNLGFMSMIMKGRVKRGVGNFIGTLKRL